MLLFVLMLVACGDSKSDGTTGAEKEVSKLSYSLAEDITSEDGFLFNLQIDNSGEAILFGKGEQGDEQPMIYVDGETTELDTDWFNMHSTMTGQGKVLGYQYNGDVYTYRFYDAFSGEETEYTLDQDFITMTFRTDYIEDENGDFEEVIRAKSPSNEFWVDIVNLADDSFETIEFTDRLADYMTSDYYSPHAFYSMDGQMIYTLIQEDSTNDNSISIIHTYNIESDEIEVVAEVDGYYVLADYNAPFTSDGEHLLLRENEGDLYKLHLASGDLEKLSDSLFFGNMDGNKYASLNKDTGEITITSLDDEANVVYTIGDMDDKRIKNFAISANGNTIAYIFQDVGTEEQLFHLHILNID